jgi:hypothetical protein
MDPVSTTYVIYDEVDQMLGADSLELIDEGTKVKASY